MSDFPVLCGQEVSIENICDTTVRKWLWLSKEQYTLYIHAQVELARKKNYAVRKRVLVVKKSYIRMDAVHFMGGLANERACVNKINTLLLII